LTITTAAALTDAPVGGAYTQTFSTAGGVGPFTFSLVSGTLPPGLTLAGAVLSGTPTTSGAYAFTLQVTDSANGTATQAFTLNVTSTAVNTPALGVWGMALLCALLLLFGTLSLSRRRVV
jgi:hypothetical protein